MEICLLVSRLHGVRDYWSGVKTRQNTLISVRTKERKLLTVENKGNDYLIYQLALVYD